MKSERCSSPPSLRVAADSREVSASAQQMSFVDRGLALADAVLAADLIVREDAQRWAELFAAAQLAREQQQLWKAAQLYAASLEVRGIASSDTRRARSHAACADMLHAMGEFADAIDHCQRALVILEPTGDNVELANVYSRLGHSLMDIGRDREAEVPYARTLALRRNSLGDDHQDVAAAHCSLGLLYSVEGQLEQAEEHYRSAMSTWGKALGANHRFVGEMLHRLAELRGRRGDPPEAERLQRQAEAICEAHGPNTLRDAENMRSQASELEARQRDDEALDLFQRALAILERELSPLDERVNSLRTVVASRLLRQKRLDEAEAIYRRELADREWRIGPQGIGVAGALFHLARVYDLREQYQEAEQFYRRALALRERRVGSSRNREIAGLYVGLAELIFKQGRLAEAELGYLHALALYRRAQESDAEESDELDRTDSLTGLALVYEKQGRFSEALNIANEAMGIFESYPGLDWEFLAGQLEGHAALLRRLGHAGEAQPFEVRAAELRANSQV